MLEGDRGLFIRAKAMGVKMVSHELISPDDKLKLAFVVIGAYRAGTTWLHRVFDEHAGICVPREKETMYFSHHFEKGVEWYRSFFTHCLKDAVVGEVCPTYLADPRCSARIHELYPEAKIIAILRKPSEQILSHYRLRKQRCLTDRPFREDIRNDPLYIHGVQYYRHLTEYFTRFKRNKILILFYEDLDSSQAEFLHVVYRFLDVEEWIPSNADARVNSASTFRFTIVEKGMSEVARFLRKKGFVKTKLFLSRFGLHILVRDWNRKDLIKDQDNTLSDEDLDWIRSETASDRAALGSLLGRDLSRWV